MTELLDRRVRAFPIAHFEHLFSPAGLLVPGRAAGVAPATSVLVRGAAGTGKTTLALGVATGIARANGAGVVYLSTEIAPDDVRFKAVDLGIATSDVGTLDAVTFLRVDHLARGASDDNVAASDRTTAALDRVGSWLVDADPALLRPGDVVVIDAFMFVGAAVDPELRVRSIELIQALGGAGVSLVLVEEAPVTGPDWASFVVDLVLELSWGEDPDTGRRLRQLGVPKSRLCRARPGPWDYGMEGSRLAVWPALTAEIIREEVGEFEPLAVLTADGEQSWFLLTGLVGSGLDGGWIRCLVSTFWVGQSFFTYGPGTGEGPEESGWGCVSSVKRGMRLLAVMSPVKVLMRPRFRHRLADTLGGLADAGVLVAVHETNEAMRQTAVTLSFENGQTTRWPITVAPLPFQALRRQAAGGALEPLDLADSNILAGRDARGIFGVREILRGDVPASLSVAARWAAAHAVYARSETAVDWLLASDERPPAVALLLARALGRRGPTEALDKTLSELAGQVELTRDQHDRLRAECLFEGGHEAGESWMLAHVEDSGAPAQSRAETLMNLASRAPPARATQLRRAARDLVPELPERA